MNELLRDHIAQHISLDSAELQLVEAALEQRTLKKNDYLLSEGQVCNYEYFVIKGGLRQYEVDPNGREIIIHFGFENWWITDKQSLYSQRPSIYYIEALEETDVLRISREDLACLSVKIPRLERYFHQVLQQSSVMWQTKILYLQKPAEQRYLMFREMYGSIEQRISQQHVAAYLGITRETLSRIKGQLLKRQ
ncbi:Crp/Fnr family transcriptional regulator [Parapedobacter lycopersici]|uniref:Crp/Fnr family transcriptional regulator n=1 Tax=Parapedobacter lycopersici TaxID=1864939 RepID=UPI0033402735